MTAASSPPGWSEVGLTLLPHRPRPASTVNSLSPFRALDTGLVDCPALGLGTHSGLLTFYKVESALRGLDDDLASSRSYSGQSTGNTVVRLHLDLDLLGYIT